MGVIIKNGVWATLANSIGASDTTIAVTAGQGERFGVIASPNYMYCTLIQGTYPYETERVMVTNLSGDTLTVTRAQDDSTAKAFSAGSRIESRAINATVRAAVREPTGNIAMSGNKLTGLGAGTQAGDSLRYEQVVGQYLPLSGGTLVGPLHLNNGTFGYQYVGVDTNNRIYGDNSYFQFGTLNNRQVQFICNSGLRLSIENAVIGVYRPLDLLSGQIKFPAAQDASTNANTLDDYEEGS